MGIPSRRFRLSEICFAGKDWFLSIGVPLNFAQKINAIVLFFFLESGINFSGIFHVLRNWKTIYDLGDFVR